MVESSLYGNPFSPCNEASRPRTSRARGAPHPASSQSGHTRGLRRGGQPGHRPAEGRPRRRGCSVCQSAVASPSRAELIVSPSFHALRQTVTQNLLCAWEVAELKGSECRFWNQRAWIRISVLLLNSASPPCPPAFTEEWLAYDLVWVSGPLHINVGSPLSPRHTSSHPQHLSLGLPPSCPSAGTFALCIVSGPLWPPLGHFPCHSLRSHLRSVPGHA